MNILQLSTDFYPRISGGAFESWEFARQASEKGHEVTVYTPRNENGISTDETVQGVRIRRPYRGTPPDRHPNSLFGVLYRLRFLLLVTVALLGTDDVADADVIYSTNYLVHPIAAVLSWYYDTPVVNLIAYSPSQNPELPWYDFRVVAERVLVRLCVGDFVFCRTPQVRALVERRTNVTAEVVHGVLDEAELEAVTRDSVRRTRTELGMDDWARNIVWVGRPVAVKNPAGAVRTLSRLPSDTRLLMVGVGEADRELDSLVDDCGVGDRLRRLGERPHDETLRTIAAGDILLVTSTVEAYPTVVFEALALRTPVVAPPVGIVPEIDHPNLHICDRDEMPAVIAAVETASTHDREVHDRDTLEAYSIGAFVETTLDRMQRMTAT